MKLEEYQKLAERIDLLLNKEHELKENIKKLMVKFPDNFKKKDAINKNLKKERY